MITGPTGIITAVSIVCVCLSVCVCACMRASMCMHVCGGNLQFSELSNEIQGNLMTYRIAGMLGIRKVW